MLSVTTGHFYFKETNLMALKTENTELNSAAISKSNSAIVQQATRIAAPSSVREYGSYGGSSTHVYVDFHLLDSNDRIISVPIYMGSVITLSYSVYRSKQSVFNCGTNTIDGFAIGNKYVAGTLIKSISSTDEFSAFLGIIKNNLMNKQLADSILPTTSKEVHDIMKDDLITCDINVIFASEYTGKIKHEVIYGANFINNGQVMSVNDIITESTMSYIARSVKPLDSTENGVSGIANNRIVNSATSLLMARKGNAA